MRAIQSALNQGVLYRGACNVPPTPWPQYCYTCMPIFWCQYYYSHDRSTVTLPPWNKVRIPVADLGFGRGGVWRYRPWQLRLHPFIICCKLKHLSVGEGGGGGQGGLLLKVPPHTLLKCLHHRLLHAGCQSQHHVSIIYD